MSRSRYKGVYGDWSYISTLATDGTICCLNEQQRSMLQTFMLPARWRTRWLNAPGQDYLDALVDETHHNLMTECTLSIAQVGCTIVLYLNGAPISSFELDGEACGLLGGADGQGGGPYTQTATGTYEEKRTALFSGAMALLRYCSESIADLFDLVESLIETGKAATVWFETCPGLDLSPAYEVLEAADAIVELEQSVFEGSDSPEYREGESCDIMCWCVANNFTFDESVIDLWLNSLNERYLIPPSCFYYEFARTVSKRYLIDRFVLGMNDEDEDWMLLCDDCAALCGVLTFDDPETDLDYTILYGGLGGDGNPDLCLHAEEIPVPPYAHGRKLETTIELDSPTTVARVVADWYHVNSSFPAGELRRQVTLLDSEESEIDIWYNLTDTTQGEWFADTLEGDDVAVGVKYIKLLGQFYCDCPGTRDLRVDNIKIYCIESP